VKVVMEFIGMFPPRQTIMFVIELLNGEEVTEVKGDTLGINPHTGVVIVSRVDGNEASATLYSPAAWARYPKSVGTTMPQYDSKLRDHHFETTGDAAA